jgi:hypothetical protein
MNSGSQREIDSLKHRMQESTTDAEAATAKLSALTAERESDPMTSRDARARWMASPATRDPHQPLPLNDAPCPPFTSHGASILLAPATRDPHQPLPLRPPHPTPFVAVGKRLLLSYAVEEVRESSRTELQEKEAALTAASDELGERGVSIVCAVHLN